MNDAINKTNKDRFPGNKNYWPCKDCTERSIGCYGMCKDYMEAVNKRNAEMKAMKAAITPIGTISRHYYR